MKHPYIGYPLAVFFGLGIFFAGLITVLGISPPSPSVVLLPETLRRWWELSYSLGGLGLACGVLTRRPGIEAIGLALIGGPFFVQAFLTLEAVGRPGIPGAVFLGFIASGCAVRWLIIVRREAK